MYIFSVPWRKKIAGKKAKTSVANVPCPGGSSACPDGSTCCQLSSGQYGCCPIQNAVCCEDHLHCCPSGYTCDVKDGRCNKGTESIPFLVKTDAIPIEIKSVPCPGGSSACPDGSTCCQLSSGQYGCCPIQNAVCCEDHLHCCPSGYTCDVKDGRCNKGTESIPFLVKTDAIHLKNEEKEPSNNICPGGSSECSDDFTCCQIPTGQYGWLFSGFILYFNPFYFISLLKILLVAHFKMRCVVQTIYIAVLTVLHVTIPKVHVSIQTYQSLIRKKRKQLPLNKPRLT
jgi:hypothetical protein